MYSATNVFKIMETFLQLQGIDYACQLPLLLQGSAKFFGLLCNILRIWLVDISTSTAYPPHSCCATVNALLSMWATMFITFFTIQNFSATCRTFLSPTKSSSSAYYALHHHHHCEMLTVINKTYYCNCYVDLGNGSNKFGNHNQNHCSKHTLSPQKWPAVVF